MRDERVDVEGRFLGSEGGEVMGQGEESNQDTHSVSHCY